MNNDTTIRFRCPTCNKRLKAPGHASGRRSSCPNCSTRVIVPAFPALTQLKVEILPEVIPVEDTSPPIIYEPPTPPEPRVPVKVSLPKVGVGVETQVSQQTADNLTYLVVGGALVAGGVLLAVTCPWLLPVAGAAAVEGLKGS